MDKHRRRARLRIKRHGHIRRRLSGTAERPRLCVFRSNKHMYAQVIDDALGHTLISACTLEPQFSDMGSAGTVEASSRLGDILGQKCLEQGIKKVVFDRAGYRFHGRVKALAEAARKQFSEAGAEGF